jgi:hypothetical protein
MLNDLLAKLDQVKGIILFSQFTLPRAAARRREIYDRVLAAGCELHAALEETALSQPSQIETFEAVLALVPQLANTPFGGRAVDVAADDLARLRAQVADMPPK